MKKLRAHFKRPVPAAAPVADPTRAPGPSGTRGADSFEAVAEPTDHVLTGHALDTLNAQIHELINKNADGINHSALKIRRETDVLLTLGISDPVAAKAGSLAQVVLELANAGRGINLQAERFDLSIEQRADLVARAMALVKRADALLGAAKRDNLPNIQAALSQQEHFLQRVRTVLEDVEP